MSNPWIDKTKCENSFKYIYTFSNNEKKIFYDDLQAMDYYANYKHRLESDVKWDDDIDG